MYSPSGPSWPRLGQILIPELCVTSTVLDSKVPRKSAVYRLFKGKSHQIAFIINTIILNRWGCKMCVAQHLLQPSASLFNGAKTKFRPTWQNTFLLVGRWIGVLVERLISKCQPVEQNMLTKNSGGATAQRKPGRLVAVSGSQTMTHIP